MDRRRIGPTWPFLCVLVGMFIIGVVSPRAWKSAIRRDADSVAKWKSVPRQAPKPLTPTPEDLPESKRVLVSRPLPLPVTPIERISSFEAVEPAAKLAARPIEMELPEVQISGPVLPSRGADVAPEVSQPIDPVWLPSRQAVGTFQLVGGSELDDAVLPVRRPMAAPELVANSRPSVWVDPAALFDQFDELAWDCETGLWSRAVVRLTRKLGQAVSQQSPDVESILEEMSELSSGAERLAAAADDHRVASRVLRAQHAFNRRIDMWREILEPGRTMTTGLEISRSWADRIASPSLDLTELLRRMEAYEKSRLNSDARSVAEVCRRLSDSSAVGLEELSQRLETHYRNANVRVAVTEELMNRLIPEREPEYANVRETILGKPVQGQSVTRTEVAARLIPDPNRLRLALEVEGMVSALTSTTRGPATFVSNSNSRYRAFKELELGTWGIRVWPAEVSVDNEMWLTSLETGVDGIPLIGSLVQGVARSQHNRKQPEVTREVEAKVSTQAKRQIDEETGQRLANVSEKLQATVFEPLAGMSLEPTKISAQTTEERIIMRVRLATDNQLGSSTPRPRAPADSLLSLQFHESALNNVIEQMELDGNTFTLAELNERISSKLNRSEMLTPNEGQEDVQITFAAADAAQVRFHDGQAVITLSIAALQKASYCWTNFQVRAFYRPEINGCSAQLVRDGVIHLIGEGLSFRSQVALRGVFSHAFDKERPWVLATEELNSDSRLAGLSITQFAVEDGWMGVALGPVRPATGPIIARRIGARTD